MFRSLFDFGSTSICNFNLEVNIEMLDSLPTQVFASKVGVRMEHDYNPIAVVTSPVPMFIEMAPTSLGLGANALIMYMNVCHFFAAVTFKIVSSSSNIEYLQSATHYS